MKNTKERSLRRSPKDFIVNKYSMQNIVTVQSTGLLYHIKNLDFYGVLISLSLVSIVLEYSAIFKLLYK